MLSRPNLYSLDICHNVDKTVIDMQLFGAQVTTGLLPQTLSILQTHAPTVLLTECDNDLNVPFIQEVVDTEIGHLFEHLIIDFLCQNEPETIRESRIYSGLTEWNWHIHPRGKFTITIWIGEKESKRLHAAVMYSSQIVQKILDSETLNLIPPAYTKTVGAVSV